MKRFRKGTLGRDLADALGEISDLPAEGDLEYAPLSKSNELRYTLGPVYMPGILDAHDEFVDEDELRKAIWELNDLDDKEIRKQHGDERIGVRKELFQWPFPVKVDLKYPDGRVTKSVTLPAGTAYAGVQWSEDAWPDVKAGKIGGLSMGGRAVRIRGADATGLEKLS